ncbi:hypothetical protein [Bradyrhizobium sp. Tv2a-2]|uniref:hypothetical protein n=1 Tax=Bradyrhizobium sp. Tv2a-2 TaxID=113395 RepID=UPI0003FBBE35|nr:hypothetical protein [Bradyrhizobium sp. Tv2a-2]
MPTDVLTLGGIVFDDFSTPETMMGGGQQAMVVHKLPGGARVIDTLGPDEADIAWRGFLFGDNAYNTALALDAMRAAGQVVPLSWGGQFRSVIVNTFIYRVRRMPVWVFYEVICTVTQNPLLGALSAVPSSIDTLVQGDLALAIGL